MTKLAGRICSKSLWLRDFELVRLANKLGVVFHLLTTNRFVVHFCHESEC